MVSTTTIGQRQYRAYVISHTHWDREWYLPFQAYRKFLVQMMDDLLDTLDHDPEYRCFTFDGQTAPLDDYLAIRPEQRDRLAKHLHAGVLEIGPWYVQPDEFLVSGESLVRNLLKGFRHARALGVEPMMVGHVPDCFGHISQLPQLFAGFGIDSAVLFRGLASSQVKHEFTWHSPDGTAILGVLMESEWAYSTLWYALRDYCEYAKPYDRDDIVQRIAALAEKHRARATTDVLLFMDGVDHAPVWHDLTRALRDANESIPDIYLQKARLGDYLQDLKKAVAGLELQPITGELRQTCRDGMSDVFMGTMVSRVHLKQANAAVERLLSKVCEPLSVFTGWLGEDYPTSYLQTAWHYLLLNHPHDSICGCSIDQVHEDMIYRFDQARLIGEHIVADRLAYLAARIDDGLGAETAASDTASYMIYNPEAQPMGPVIRLTLPLDEGWRADQCLFSTPDGTAVPHQVLDAVADTLLVKEFTAVPLFLPETRVDLVVELPDPIPSMGYATIVVRRATVPVHPTGTLCPTPRQMENEWLHVRVNDSGTFDLRHKPSGRTFTDQLLFEDVGDVGDGWKFRPAPYGGTVTSVGSPVTIRRLHDGPLAAQYEVRITMTVPDSVSLENGHRSTRTGENTITSVITLQKGCPYIGVETTVQNTTRDHAIRALFPTGLRGATHTAADTPFDVVERPIALPDTAGWPEPAYSSWPRQSFVDVADHQSGLAILSEGMYEYDIRDDADRTLSIMLLRGYRNVIGRPHDEGGQVLGTHRFRFALFPHDGDWRAAGIPALAQAFRAVPLSTRLRPPRRGSALPMPLRTLPPVQSFLSISPSTVLLSAIKQAEDSDALIVRCYHLGNTACEAVMKCGQPMIEAHLVNLDEQPISPMQVGGDRITLTVAPRQIITLALRFSATQS
jgi:alpha-mannosidase/mannosylglycerate hydrolase